MSGIIANREQGGGAEWERQTELANCVNISTEVDMQGPGLLAYSMQAALRQNIISFS